MVVLITLTIAGAGPACAAETIESVEAKLDALWEKVDTFTASIDFIGEEQEGGVQVKVEGTGKIEYMKQEGADLTRMETINTISMGDQTIEQKMLTVFDGTTTYLQSEFMGQVNVQELEQGGDSSRDPMGGKALFESLRKENTVELLQEETVADEKVYVLSLTAKHAPAGTQPKQLFYISQKTGLLVKTISMDETGKTTATNLYKDYKLNPRIDPAHFKYTRTENSHQATPDGIAVIDKASTPIPARVSQPQIDTGLNVGDTKTVDLGGGVHLEFVWIDSGSFIMGRSGWVKGEPDPTGPQHPVQISKGFWLGKYEVIQAQWEAVMGNNPSKFQGSKNPVEQVSWNDCQEFIKKLNAKTGERYRLPTEAEWEYACRAGSIGKFSSGDSDSSFGEYAWYSSNSSDKTHLAGQKRPNAWGLFDMHGNVSEWCQDSFAGDYYAQSPAVDPAGPSSGGFRVVRGGCWQNIPWRCQSAFRTRAAPAIHFDGLGFRVVLSAPSLQKVVQSSD